MHETEKLSCVVVDPGIPWAVGLLLPLGGWNLAKQNQPVAGEVEVPD